MRGVAAHPTSTLLDRALAYLADGPRGAGDLARDVFDIRNASDAVAGRLTVALLGADPRVHQLPDTRWCLSPAAAGSPSLDDCAFAVVDVETTGGIRRNQGPGRSGGGGGGGGSGRGRERGDRITEIAVVVVQGERIETVCDTLVNPEQPIAPMISAITNITNDMVRDAPTFAEVADEVLAALAGRVFVAHNARFDWGVVAGELRRARGVELAGPQVCTVRLSRRLIDDLESCSLDSVAHYFDLDNPARHRAAGDALVTARLLGLLLQRARERDIRTLRELERLLATPARRKRRPASTRRP